MSCSSNKPADTNCPSAEAMLPVDPFTALEVHFGMLLGVDDLDTLAANPRGKGRLHNAWLHREGVVWGFGLEIQHAGETADDAARRGELQVNPGLALDALGHELHLDVPSCVNLGAWYEAHKSDPDFSVTTNGTQVTFDAHVVLRFKACLTRPVPAIASSCESATTDVAYSRAFETVEVLLLPNLSTAKALPYHRLRLLFGLDDPKLTNGSVDPEDAAIVARREDIRNNHPLDAQPRLYLEAFREYAALDTTELSPPVDAESVRGLFPESDPCELLLGDVQGITLDQAGDGRWALLTPLPTLIPKVRPSHVATATIQELLCGPILGAGSILDAGGPRFDPESVVLTDRTLTLTSTSPLSASTVQSSVFSLTSYDDDNGWSTVDIKSVTLDTAGTGVSIELKEDPGGTLLRLVAAGTGPTPILGQAPDYIPLAGAIGGPPGSTNNGNDFAFMWKRS